MIKRPGQMLVPDDNKIVQNLKHKSVRNLKDKNKNKNMIVGIDFNACIKLFNPFMLLSYLVTDSCYIKQTVKLSK